MKIKIVNRSKHKLLKYTTEKSAGMDLRTYRKGIEMNKISKIAGSLILAILVLAGCTKKITPAISKKGEFKSFDSSAFEYVYIEALKQKYLGNTADALKYLEQCIVLNPRNDAAYYEIAQIAFQGGDIPNAKKFALKSVELNEKNEWYLSMLASIYLRDKVLDSTIFYLEKAVKYFPEKENLKISLGNIYSEKGDYNKANEIFKYLENKYGANDNSTLYFVRNLMNSGDLKGAENKVNELLKIKPEEILYNGLLAEIYRAEGETGKATEVYRKLMESDSDNPQTLLSLEDFMVTEKQYDELFKVLNTIILNNKVSREDKISLFSKMIDNDDLIKNKGNELEMIILVLESAYEKDDIISLLRPELYQKELKIDEAIDRLNDLITINPENYYAWEKLLILYADNGDYDNLFIKGKECATKFNMSFTAKILYASAAIEKNELDIAQEELRKAKILAGDNKEMQIQVLTMEADAFYRKKEFTKSFETFKEALKLNPDDIIILNNYAYYLAEQGQELKEAERMSKIVVDKEKDNGTYLDTYAWILYKQGKAKEAARIMEEILKKGGKEDAEWCEHYGFMMKKLKKCDTAVEYWKKAQSLDHNKTYLDKDIKDCTK